MLLLSLNISYTRLKLLEVFASGNTGDVIRERAIRVADRYQLTLYDAGYTYLRFTYVDDRNRVRVIFFDMENEVFVKGDR